MHKPYILNIFFPVTDNIRCYILLDYDSKAQGRAKDMLMYRYKPGLRLDQYSNRNSFN